MLETLYNNAVYCGKMQLMGGLMNKANRFGRVIAVCFWICMVVILFVHRDEITVEKIVGFTPDNALLAILVMLALFALKGSTMLINGNVLYTACGVMFSLPLAVMVNVLGSVIMTTISFWIGRKGGAATMERLTQKYRKLEMLRSVPHENQFLSTLLLRILGILPCEPVGMYLGACRLRYLDYIGGTLLGLLPAIISYAVMGEYASEPTSPQFIAAVAFQIMTTVCTLIAGVILKRKKKVHQGGTGNN